MSMNWTSKLARPLGRMFRPAQRIPAEFLDRTLVRADFESRFTVERMARDYLTLYSQAAESLVNAEVIHQLNGNLPCQEVA